jgi:hypothetical protein
MYVDSPVAINNNPNTAIVNLPADGNFLRCTVIHRVILERMLIFTVWWTRTNLFHLVMLNLKSREFPLNHESS